MKGDKKILVIAILLLLISVGFTTYAIYKSTTTATGSVKLSGWSVKIDDTNLESITTMTLDLTSCSGTHNGKNNTLAPGDSCSITIPVDLTGSEVDAVVTAAIANITNAPSGMTITLASGSDSQDVTYAASNMKANVVINVAWPTTATAVDNNDQGKTVTFDLTLTASQKNYQ